MGNIYILAENEDCELVDVTDMESDKQPVKQFVVHQAEGIKKAMRLSQEGMSIEDIAERFCGNCGNYIQSRIEDYVFVTEDCGCSCGCEPQII